MNDPRPPDGEPSVALVAELDRLQLRAWPAAHEETLGGWRLRFTNGVTRRANSVLPHGPTPPDIEDAIARVEAAYAERGLKPRFLVSPAASPPELDTVLADGGYAAEAATLVQTAGLPLRPLPVAKGIEVEVGDFDEAWLSAYAAAESLTPGEVEGRRGIHRRIRADAGCATARVDGRTVGVGSVVVEDGWAGIHNMATATGFRRRGAARAVLSALLEWAAVRGATHSYLAVMETNEAARALYEGSRLHDGLPVLVPRHAPVAASSTTPRSARAPAPRRRPGWPGRARSAGRGDRPAPSPPRRA